MPAKQPTPKQEPATKAGRCLARRFMKTLIKDCSVSAIVAGCIATTISYAGPLVIIFHAAEAAGLSHQQLSSWVWAVSMGSAVLGALLSLRYRVPVVIAWSIPGSALLVTALPLGI